MMEGDIGSRRKDSDEYRQMGIDSTDVSRKEEKPQRRRKRDMIKRWLGLAERSRHHEGPTGQQQQQQQELILQENVDLLDRARRTDSDVSGSSEVGSGRAFDEMVKFHESSQSLPTVESFHHEEVSSVDGSSSVKQDQHSDDSAHEIEERRSRSRLRYASSTSSVPRQHQPEKIGYLDRHMSAGSNPAEDGSVLRSRGVSHGNAGILTHELPPGCRFELLVDPIPPSDRHSLVGLSQTWKNNLKDNLPDSEPGMQILYGSLPYIIQFLVGSRGLGYWNCFLNTYSQYTTPGEVLQQLKNILDDDFMNNRELYLYCASDEGILAVASRVIKELEDDTDIDEEEDDEEDGHQEQASITDVDNEEGDQDQEDQTETDLDDSTDTPNGIKKDNLNGMNGNTVQKTTSPNRPMPTPISGSTAQPPPPSGSNPRNEETLRRLMKELGLDASLVTMQDNAVSLLSFWIIDGNGTQELGEADLEQAKEIIVKYERKSVPSSSVESEDVYTYSLDEASSMSTSTVGDFATPPELIRLQSAPASSGSPNNRTISNQSLLIGTRNHTTPIFESSGGSAASSIASESTDQQQTGTANMLDHDFDMAVEVPMSPPPPPQQQQQQQQQHQGFSEDESASTSSKGRQRKSFVSGVRSRSLSHSWKKSSSKKKSSESKKGTATSPVNTTKNVELDIERELKKYTPQQVAHAITWMLYNRAYRHIRVQDLVTQKARDNSKAVRRMIEMFDCLAWWPLSWILNRQIEILERVERVLFFLDVAVECRKVHNYHAFFGIVAGLSQPLMQWMWDFIKKEDKHRLEHLKRAVKSKGDYLVYRADLSKCTNKSHIPFLGLTTKLLYPLEHGMAVRSPDAEHMINFGRCVSVQNTIEDFLRGQQFGFEVDVQSLSASASLVAMSPSSASQSSRRQSSNSVSSIPPEGSSPSSPSSMGSPRVSSPSPTGATGRKSIATSISSTLSGSGTASIGPLEFHLPFQIEGTKSRGGSLSTVPMVLPTVTRLQVDPKVIFLIESGIHRRKSKERLEKVSAKLKKRLCEDLVETLESSGFM